MPCEWSHIPYVHARPAHHRNAGTTSAQHPAPTGDIHHLRAAGVSLVIDTRGPGLPRIVHWGADLGDLSSDLLQNLATADVPSVVTNVPDEPVIPGIVTEHATGWMGLPGLIGHRERQGMVDLVLGDRGRDGHRPGRHPAGRHQFS